ncbi:hypothetical protein Y032_0016g3118 [Ancylostoma ceylanicum]|uniref:Uncharacterized protein n=1 Tax=Ancylostoma ceylanicum TaxID=53326 RepID=A0A016V7X5_9BILA|nr:hypothetical protein Y032_0016g3118 [Ancylostoma ceylanicum]
MHLVRHTDLEIYRQGIKSSILTRRESVLLLSMRLGFIAGFLFGYCFSTRLLWRLQDFRNRSDNGSR